ACSCFFFIVTVVCLFFFFFQAEDGIRDFHVTGVQTCALPIYGPRFAGTKARLFFSFQSRFDVRPERIRNARETGGTLPFRLRCPETRRNAPAWQGICRRPPA